MLDHVERRAFFVQPARKYPIPFAVGLEIVELDERAGQSLGFPRRGRIARPKANGDVLDPDRLTRLEREIADDPVALVEQGDHRHSIGHRGHARSVDPRRKGFGNDFILCHRLLAIARRNREAQREQPKDARRNHVWSGVQAL